MSAERLREQDREQRVVARCRDEHGARRPAAGRPARSSQAISGSSCTRVDADEVRHAEIAVLAAPAGQRQPGSAVGRADGVRRRRPSCRVRARRLELRARRRRHQPAGRLTDHRQQHAEAQRPAEGCVVEPVAEQRRRSARSRRPTARRWPMPMIAEQRRVERRGRVEVAGDAARRLQVDDPDLEHQHHGRDPPDDRGQPPPLREEREDPGQREGVDRRRDRELRRLQPRRRAEDLAWCRPPSRSATRRSAASITQPDRRSAARSRSRDAVMLS